MEVRDVIVIGAGLAGLTAAIELSKAGLDVVVFDKRTLPRHKVCGEYLSMEVVPYLESMGVSLEDAPRIDRLVLSRNDRQVIESKLPLGGIGISRYALDYRLYEQALKRGVHFIWKPVESVRFEHDAFTVASRGELYKARQVLGAWGKRSNMDRSLNRSFWLRESPWMGIKMHYEAAYPSNQVGLYCFKGGYGGLSVTETGAVNFCYLVHRDRFRETPDLEACTRGLLEEHPSLGSILGASTPLFKAALGISNIPFGKKGLVSRHILLGGDAAQLIHPLCGNGMAMAIDTGRMQGSIVSDFLTAAHPDRAAMEEHFQKEWRKRFATRLRTGAFLQRLLLSSKGMDLGMRLAVTAPSILRKVIQKTHGAL